MTKQVGGVGGTPNSYRLILILLAIMLLACASEPAITGARSAAKTCAIALVGDPNANVKSLDFAGGFDGHWTATGKYNDGANVFSVSFTLEPCTQISIDTQ